MNLQLGDLGHVEVLPLLHESAERVLETLKVVKGIIIHRDHSSRGGCGLSTTDMLQLTRRQLGKDGVRG